MQGDEVTMKDGKMMVMRNVETMPIDRRQTGDAEDLSDNQFKEAMEDEELRDQM